MNGMNGLPRGGGEGLINAAKIGNLQRLVALLEQGTPLEFRTTREVCKIKIDYI